MKEQYVYMGSKPCGCIVAVVCDAGDEDTGRAVGEFIADGFTVGRIEFSAYLELIKAETFMNCPHVDQPVLSAPCPVCNSRNTRFGAEYEDAAFTGYFFHCDDCGHYHESGNQGPGDDYLLATPYPVVAALLGDVILWLKKHDQYDGDLDDIADELAEAREEAGGWDGAAIRLILTREGWEGLDAEFAAIIDGGQALETAVAEASA